MKPLQGKRALVTGAGKGIGRGVAVALAEAGANVMVHYRSSPAEAAEVVAACRAHGVEAFSHPADLGDLAQLDGLFREVEAKLGGLDIAVNNAGWDPGHVELESIDETFYYRLTDMNVKGTLFCCLREIAMMRRQGAGGSVVNVGSMHMETSVPGRTVYALSKGAIHAMTGQLALEAGPFGIRVNNLVPGYVEVERLRDRPDYDAAAVGRDIPIGRVGTPEDIGAVAVFLASDAAGFVSGHSLVADGGVHRKLARSGSVAGPAQPMI